MARRRRRSSGGFAGPLVLAILMGAVAYTIIKQPPVSVPPTPTPGSNVATSTTRAAALPSVHLGVPVPGGRSDRLFILSPSDGRVEEQIVETGWRLGSATGTPRIERRTGTEDVFALTGGEWNVPLRAKDGRAYAQARLEGSIDASHVWVSARIPAPVLLSVSVSGDIRELYRFPDNGQLLGVSYGLAWIGTFTPGEGIESPPSGPSELMRIGEDGMPQSVAKDDSVIAEAVAGPQGAFAYLTESGDTVARSGTDTWRGQGRPLAWIDERRLLVAKGTSVLLLDLTRAELTSVGTLPLAPTKGWL